MPFKDPEKRKAYHRKWYLENRDEVITRSAAYLSEHKDDPERKKKVSERMRQWHADNRERIREVSRVWAENNRDKKAACARRHYEKNTEACKARHREWMKIHPEKNRLYHFRRRVDKDCPPLSMKTLDAIVENNINTYGELTCVYCGPLGEKKMVIDHLIPGARGGGNEFENLAVSCFSCNAKKHAKTYDEFIEERFYKGELQSQT
jgi:5-methylcytosine-specific restriction endonuclease McrA